MGMVIADGPDGSLHVLAVQPGGGAASAGLKEGDEILAVNGARTVGEPPNLTSVQGASVRFLMRRDGVERNIDVRPTVLVP
jgi:S1-C subfamily serine protease